MNAVLLLAQGGPISVRCTSLLLGAIEAPSVGELAARTSLRGDVEVAHPATFPGFSTMHSFFASATPARTAEAARAAILGCSAARVRARRRAIGEPWRRIDAPGRAQGALGGVEDLNWRLWVAPGLRGTSFCASTAPRAPPRRR